MIKGVFILGFAVSGTALGLKSRCIQGEDWLPFCSLPEAPGTRCAVLSNSTGMFVCSPETDGCAAIGGCFGDVPPGYWYPTGENGVAYKCRCGCVAGSETQFETSLGILTGKDLYARKEESEILVSTVDSLEAPWLRSPKKINTLMSSKSAEKSFRIDTKSGRFVIASPGHPVLIAEKDGTPTVMKKASDIGVGDQVLTIDGEVDEVMRVEQIDYKEELMNFNVVSARSAEHIVPMNGVLLGDSAWQERLNSRDARVLLRAEVAREFITEGQK